MLEEGLLREEQGAYSEALRWYTRGEKALPAIDDDVVRGRLRIALMRARAQARFRQGRYDEALDLAGQVVERAADLDDLGDLAHAYYLSHVIHTLRGDPERHAFRGLALPIFEETGDLVGQASVLNNLGIEAYYEGRWDEARDLYERSRSLRERIGDVINVGHDDQQHRRDRARPGTLRRRRGALPRRASHRRLRRASADLGRLAREPQPPRRALRPLHGRRRAAHRRARDTRRDRLGPVPTRVPGAPRGVADPERRRPGRGRPGWRRRRSRSASGKGCTPTVQALLERIRATCFARREDLPGARKALQRALEIAKSAQADYESALALRAIAWLEGARADETATAIFARLGVDESALPQL